MLRLRLVVGNEVRSLGCGGGYTSSTRQRDVSVMGEFMSTIQYSTSAVFDVFDHVKLKLCHLIRS